MHHHAFHRPLWSDAQSAIADIANLPGLLTADERSPLALIGMLMPPFTT